MKKIKDFKENAIDGSKINAGGDLTPIGTKSGIIMGNMYYSRDEFLDADHDGKWSSGETLTFYYDEPPKLPEISRG